MSLSCILLPCTRDDTSMDGHPPENPTTLKQVYGDPNGGEIEKVTFCLVYYQENCQLISLLAADPSPIHPDYN